MAKIQGGPTRNSRTNTKERKNKEKTIALIAEKRQLKRTEKNYEEKRELLTRKTASFARKDKNDFIISQENSFAK